jgi:hypothetical protein
MPPIWQDAIDTYHHPYEPMLRNYFRLHAAYKRITHTKKIQEGDWCLVMKRKKSRKAARTYMNFQPKTTILVGQIVGMTQSSVDLNVGHSDAFLADQEGVTKIPHLRSNTMREGVKEDGTQVFLWRPEWSLEQGTKRPVLNETVLYFLYVNM